MTDTISTPLLYKIDSQGITRVWRAWTELNEDGTATEQNESGILNGKMSGIPIVVTAGKNIGKKNETTPLQQANKNITSKYEKKLKEGYVTDLAEFTQQGVMKAHEWRVSKHRMTPVALKQPKLDGIRCKVIKKSDGSILLTSKSNTEFKEFLYDLPWVNHINHTIDEGEVDGELYIHGLDLNDIASLVMSYKMTTDEFLENCEMVDEGLKINLKKKEILDQVYAGNFVALQDISSKTPSFDPDMDVIEVGRNKAWIFPGFTMDDVETVGTLQLEYWAFDMPDEDSTAELRNIRLQEVFDNSDARDHGLLALIADEFNIEDIEEANAMYVNMGFEGTMVRKPSGLYAFGERTADLQKYKLFFDAEWEIKGHTIDREGNPTLTFISDAGVEFESRPVGNRAFRARVLRDMDSLIGEKATIRYQGLFQDTLKPQFGRVVAIRDYE